jgi:hypothetical protein
LELELIALLRHLVFPKYRENPMAQKHNLLAYPIKYRTFTQTNNHFITKSFYPNEKVNPPVRPL